MLLIYCFPVSAGRRSPTRLSLGTASLSISSLLVFSSVAKPELTL